MGLYYSGGFDWSFDFRLPEGRYHPTMPGFIELLTLITIITGGDYGKYADDHLRELVAKYEPDILWNDIDYPRGGQLLDIIADYFNK